MSLKPTPYQLTGPQPEYPKRHKYLLRTDPFAVASRISLDEVRANASFIFKVDAQVLAGSCKTKPRSCCIGPP